MDIEIYKALSDFNRLRILNVLFSRKLCVCEIEAALNMSQSNVSRHLNKLKNSGLVGFEKDAQWIYYYISETFIADNKYLIMHLREKFGLEKIFLEESKNLVQINKESLCKRI